MEDVFEILLHNCRMGDLDEKSTCNVVASCQLIPFGIRELIRFEIREQSPKKLESYSPNIVLASFRRKDLIDPIIKYIQDDSFVVEIKFRVEMVQGMEEKKFCREKTNAIKLQCPVCFDDLADKPTSMIITCSHIFCTECCWAALQENQCCPNCRKDATVQDIRVAYLPL